LTADEGSLKVEHDNYCDVVFVGGAVRVGEDWILAAGVHDRWIELHRFSHSDLEKRLVKVDN
jgi:hypothetical protein